MNGLERTKLLAGVERLFLKHSLSLGALTMLTGCDLSNGDAVQRVLHFLDGWNERAQAALFGPDRLARTFGEAEWAKDFRYNAFSRGTKRPRSMPPTTGWNWPGWWETNALGPTTHWPRCHRKARSSSTSASKAGA